MGALGVRARREERWATKTNVKTIYIHSSHKCTLVEREEERRLLLLGVRARRREADLLFEALGARARRRARFLEGRTYYLDPLPSAHPAAAFLGGGFRVAGLKRIKAYAQKYRCSFNS